MYCWSYTETERPANHVFQDKSSPFVCKCDDMHQVHSAHQTYLEYIQYIKVY